MKRIDSRLDVYSLVRQFSERVKRLEQRLVDQRIALEVMGLRLAEYQRGRSLDFNLGTNIVRVDEAKDGAIVKGGKLTLSQRASPDQLLGLAPVETSERSSNGLDSGSWTEIERLILKLVFESNGKLAAKDIQSRIGKSREHTARVMNSLFKRGFVMRESSTRPFIYSITDYGRRVIAG